MSVPVVEPSQTARLSRLMAEDPALGARFRRLRRFSARVRVSEYHLTNACNLRCRGCWFFEFGHDRDSREVTDLGRLDAFVRSERERRINTALLIGGEPTLVPERIDVFRRHMTHVTISTNGLHPLPYDGYEDVAIGVTLFGGGPLDDELRAIRPGGRRFRGLFDRALTSYRDDPRVGFIYAVTENGIDHVEDTVARIADNGNRVTFNFYSAYGTDDPLAMTQQARLLDELLRVRSAYPDVVMSHPTYIRALITGRTSWGTFGYETCPSISVDHPAHAERIRNGNPVLPRFATWGADLETLKTCCTSGHCDGCRDSQAVQSWLLVSSRHFLDDLSTLRTWVELAESYWSQFVWSPWSPHHRDHVVRVPQLVPECGA